MKTTINKIIMSLLFSFVFILLPMSIAKAENITFTNGTTILDATMNNDVYYTGENIDIYGDLYNVYGVYNSIYSQATAVISGTSDIPSSIVSGIAPPVSGFLTGSATIKAPSSAGSYEMIITLSDQYGNTATNIIPFTVIVKPNPTLEVFANGDKTETTIKKGENVRIYWNSTNADWCSCSYIDNGVKTDCTPSGITTGFNIYAKGSPFTLAESKTFSVQCHN